MSEKMAQQGPYDLVIGDRTFRMKDFDQDIRTALSKFLSVMMVIYT